MTDSYASTDNGTGDSVSRVSELAGQVKNLGKEVKDQATVISETVLEGAKDQANEIGTAAKEIAVDASNRVKLVIDEQKVASADYLAKIAEATQRAAGEFETDAPQAARYIRKAAGEIETVANTVRSRDLRELLTGVNEFARREPTLFFGGALILGFAGLRFFKSSGSALSQPSNAGSYSTSGLRNSPQSPTN